MGGAGRAAGAGPWTCPAAGRAAVCPQGPRGRPGFPSRPEPPSAVPKPWSAAPRTLWGRTLRRCCAWPVGGRGPLSAAGPVASHCHGGSWLGALCPEHALAFLSRSKQTECSVVFRWENALVLDLNPGASEAGEDSLSYVNKTVTLCSYCANAHSSSLSAHVRQGHGDTMGFFRTAVRLQSSLELRPWLLSRVARLVSPGPVTCPLPASSFLL